ncbi:ImmA/IrrE family metallo-endopeptidase [Chromobacterium haemolyticum]|uniref:ImmA/IrrE family metallo-endopeptidase n=1 Tax=Chromobacterium haemolyticum TaxID=394935 RepID=UPI00307E12AF
MAYVHSFPDLQFIDPVACARGVLSRNWNGFLPVDPSWLAAAEGADVRGEAYLNDIPGGPLSGAFGYENGRPTIVYNPYEHANRQRFTIAHELGHMMCSHLRGEDGNALFRDPAANFTGDVTDPRETEANQFAAEILMPEEAVRHLVRSWHTPSIRYLATQFQVSTQAMNFRLINLGLINPYNAEY